MIWRRSLISGALLAAAALGAMVLISTRGDGEAATTSTEGLARQMSAETVEVSRRDLDEDLTLNGTVTHGEPDSLAVEADGIVTATVEQDQVVGPGDELVRVNNRPITLAEGRVPLYRELRRVGKWDVDEAGDRLGLQEGPDVEQLQRFLLAQGFDDDERLEVDGVFGLTTERAVESWQRDRGHPATGRVDRTQLLFVEGPMRIESAPEVGERFDQITVGALHPFVELQVANRQRGYFPEGRQVSIDIDGRAKSGVVAEVERVIGADGTARHDVRIELGDDETGIEEQVVEVTSVRPIAENVLTVPARALVALAEGGWAVQVETDTGFALTAIELGDVIDGVAEVSGVDEGTRVVIPS